MKKLFILLSFVIFGQVSFGQVYQLMPQYGYEVKRMSFDSTLQIPTICGVPTLKSVYNVKRGAIAFDSCNNRFYTYNPKTTTWSYLGSGGGGSQDLQSVTDLGSTTTNFITHTDGTFEWVKILNDGVYGVVQTRFRDGGDTSRVEINGKFLSFINDVNHYDCSLQFPNLNENSYEIILPKHNGFLVSTINLNEPDDYGNVSINIIDSIKRKSGTDSVFAKRNGNWIFQYKDSIGGGSGFVPYTGATQDVDLGINKISAESVYITGTNGNGHLHLKHQASDATATGQSTALFADANGDLKWKNDGNYYSTLKTSNQTANRIYTYQNKSYTLGDSADISARVKYTDTASMLTNYAKTSAVNLKVNISDTANMLTNYAKTSAVNLKVNISDTASMLANYQLKTPSIAYLSSDFNTTNTTATNTNLTIPVEANTAYRIMISGSASKATSSTGMKISIGAPTGTTIKATAALGSNAISTIVNSFITSINTLGSTFATGVAVEVPFRVEGILVTGSTSGSITLQGATVTSNTATIYANTLMTLTKAYAQ